MTKRASTRLVSAIWAGLSGLARGLARSGVLNVVDLSQEIYPAKRVVSVGNLQAGGAGKTPLVAQLAREAHEKGLSVCILIRGYGGSWEHTGGVIDSQDSLRHKAKPTAAESGDEALLLSDLVPSAYIGVGADRVRAYRMACLEKGSGFDLVILDDGFQHWKIRKDLNIVAVTSGGPWSRVFRDSVSALKYADLVVWTKGDTRPFYIDAFAKEQVRVRFQLQAPAEEKKRVWLVTGIADSESARSSAARAGYQILKQISFPDHARYTSEDVDRILGQAKRENNWIAVTGKDWVKWREFSAFAGPVSQPVVVLEPELVFEEGREVWLQKLWANT
ncbi:tetraacyldisaccharide 4'-kinase [bacterium]|jgi:tetraacyldisaccharide 4'-kinase|nr:tetraacyldisaccharide 4'-kinase [bacterium]